MSEFITSALVGGQSLEHISRARMLNTSQVGGQSSVNISLALHARDVTTSRLTFNQRYIGQQIIVSKNLFLK